MSVAIERLDALVGLRGMAPDSVDLVLTDFPYESLERHRAKGTTTRLKVSKSSSNPWFPVLSNEVLLEIVAETYRVLKPCRHAYFFCDDETGHLLWEATSRVGFYPWKFLTWAKTVTEGDGRWAVGGGEQPATPWSTSARLMRAGTGYHWPSATERILFVEKRSKAYVPPPWPKPRPDPPGKGRQLLGGSFDRQRGHAGDLLFSPRAPKGYPTEKPVAVQEVIVAQSSAVGETVLDPCCGSGSSLVAARRLGRSVVGFDVQEDAVEITTRRLMEIS